MRESPKAVWETRTGPIVLDIEDFRPALSAPPIALEMAIEWLAESHGGPQSYLASAAGMTDHDLSALRSLLIP